MQQQPTTARIAVKYGLIAGIASIVFVTVMYVTGQATNTALSWLSMIIPIVVMYLAMKEFKEENGGFMSYSQGLGIGTMMSAVSGILSAFYSYIYNEFIDTSLRQQIMDKMREGFEEQGMDDAQIDAALEMSSKFSSPGFTFIFGLLGAIIIGFVIALILSAIMKKDKPFELD